MNQRTESFSWHRLGGLAGALLAGIVLLGLVLPGCQGRTRPVPINGKLVRKGIGVPNLILTFHPQEDRNKDCTVNPVSDTDGEFHCACVPGFYKVTVAPGPAGDVAPIPNNFQSLITTPWGVNVSDADNPKIVLTIADR
jgi:hypothetical protein